MRFIDLPIKGAHLIELNKLGDERGFFARMFCQEAFAQRGLETTFVQMNNSRSAQKGTLRGLHFQIPPKEEVKLVRCIEGEIFDVVLDLRKESPTFGKWHGELLSAQNRTMMYVPKGCAHGFLTVTQESEVIYLVSSPYDPALERGVRWNDPSFNIAWTAEPSLISKRDQEHPLFENWIFQ